MKKVFYFIKLRAYFSVCHKIHFSIIKLHNVSFNSFFSQYFRGGPEVENITHKLVTIIQVHPSKLSSFIDPPIINYDLNI